MGSFYFKGPRVWGSFWACSIINPKPQTPLIVVLELHVMCRDSFWGHAYCDYPSRFRIVEQGKHLYRSCCFVAVWGCQQVV